MEDKIDLNRLYDSVKADIPEGSTHFVLTWAAQGNAGLWRLSDGMYLGEAGDKTVVFGENPNKRESRLFLTHQHARKFLMEEVAGETGTPAVIFDLDIEQHMAKSMLVLPETALSLVVNGDRPVTGKAPNCMKLN